MKVYNPKLDGVLNNELVNILNQYRKNKNFNAIDYINNKSLILNNYMKKFNLKSIIVGVSGGIDSAVVLGLIDYAKNQPNSPIEKIVPVSLPVFNSGATGQDTARNRAIEYISQLNLSPNVVDLSTSHDVLSNTIEKTLNIHSEDWAKGQLVSYIRTPALYYISSLLTQLTQEGKPGIVAGTTNRDEGLYLGYFGKASDGLVDIQLISDLHKSEVYKVGQALNVPKSILNITPQGDMFDGRIDEEVFGATYDFVELYLYYLSLSLDNKINIIKQLNSAAKEQFDFLSSNLENLHSYNKHKYLNSSPAIHLDIDVLNIENGWKTNCNNTIEIEKKINTDNFNGFFESSKISNIFNSGEQYDYNR